MNHDTRISRQLSVYTVRALWANSPPLCRQSRNNHITRMYKVQGPRDVTDIEFSTKKFRVLLFIRVASVAHDGQAKFQKEGKKIFSSFVETELQINFRFANEWEKDERKLAKGEERWRDWRAGGRAGRKSTAPNPIYPRAPKYRATPLFAASLSQLSCRALPTADLQPSHIYADNCWIYGRPEICGGWRRRWRNFDFISLQIVSQRRHTKTVCINACVDANVRSSGSALFAPATILWWRQMISVRGVVDWSR